MSRGEGGGTSTAVNLFSIPKSLLFLSSNLIYLLEAE
jgi:hypothetical protein